MAENTIDNLSIQVTASAENAVRVFDRLASSAGKVKNAASGAAGSMQDMAQGAQDAGTATQEAGTQAGKARPNIKGVGKDAKDAGESAKKGTAGISSFWQALKRVAFYRFVRTVLKEIGNAFKEGAQNLYQWSTANPSLSDFAKNMNRIATAVLYLKNSLGAMLQPIVRILAPIIDGIIDGIVKVINLINQLFSALSGATTYTVAKKVATTWADAGKTAASSAKKAADDIKRTILGFDEINKLEKQNTSGSSSGSGSNTPGNAVSDMFETKPLDGWAKALSDFINKIKKWMQPVLDWFDKLGNKIKHLWDGFVDGAKDFFSDPLDWLKKNVADPITNGLRKLFGINSPSTEMKIIGTYLVQGLKEGMLEEMAGMDNWIKTNIVDVIKKAFSSKSPLYVTPALNNTGKTLFNTLKKSWNSEKTVLYVTPALNNTGKTLFNSLKKNWDSSKKKLFVTPDLDNTGKALFEILKKSWDEAKTKLYATPELNNTGKVLFNTLKKNWNDNKSILYAKPDLNNTGKTLFNNLKKNWDENKSKLYAEPALNTTGAEMFYEFKDSWEYRKSDLGVNVALECTGSEAFYDFKSDWDYFKTTLYATPELNNTGKTLFNELKDSWDWHKTKLYATPSLNTTGKAIWLEFKKSWNNAKTNLKASVTVSTKKTGNYGGATGAGGTTSGSGAGRTRHALGGVITPHSESWFGKVPSYASGTTNARGTMFLAGEAGPEIVGHVGGRTEVLNKSQLAATMYSAVRNAMSGVTLEANFNNVDTGASSIDSMEMLGEMVRQGVEQAMVRQNELDRQRNEYLRQINDKDYNLDISTASINKAQTRTNRRAGTTIVPVGT